MVLGCQKKDVLFVVARITGCLVVRPTEQENAVATILRFLQGKAPESVKLSLSNVKKLQHPDLLEEAFHSVADAVFVLNASNPPTAFSLLVIT